MVFKIVLSVSKCLTVFWTDFEVFKAGRLYIMYGCFCLRKVCDLGWLYACFATEHIETEYLHSLPTYVLVYHSFIINVT